MTPIRNVSDRERKMQAEIVKLKADIANYLTVAMAAAVEIQEHWDAHCDAEGYGPVNLMRRLENGFPAQYGYTAKSLIEAEAERDALKADALRYRWLREQEDTAPVFCMYGKNGRWGECGHSEIYGDLLDSTIDAAMKEGAK